MGNAFSVNNAMIQMTITTSSITGCIGFLLVRD